MTMDLNNLNINDSSFFDYLKTNNQPTINLIVGKNGIGKTRLLEAIAEYSHWLPINGCYQVDLFSFKEAELKELIEDWLALSKKYPNARGHILKLLRMIEPRFDDIDCGDDNDELAVVLSEQEEYVDINDMSSGFKRLFEIMVKAWTCDGGILLIDDIELGLHCSLQKPLLSYLVKTAKERNNQIFITTHSGDTIMAFANATSDDGDVCGTLIRLEYSMRKSDQGDLLLTTFNESKLANLYSMGIDARCQ